MWEMWNKTPDLNLLLGNMGREAGEMEEEVYSPLNVCICTEDINRKAERPVSAS